MPCNHVSGARFQEALFVAARVVTPLLTLVSTMARGNTTTRHDHQPEPRRACRPSYPIAACRLQ